MADARLRSTSAPHSSRRGRPNGLSIQAALSLAFVGAALSCALARPALAGEATARPSAPASSAPATPAERSGVQQWGLKLGYGTSDKGQVEILPVYGEAGWSFPDVIDQPLIRHHVDFQWLLEGWLAGIHTPRSDAFEFGINPITLKLAYDAGQQFVPYLQGGIGVMYTSLQDGLKLGGPFEFDEGGGRASISSAPTTSL